MSLGVRYRTPSAKQQSIVLADVQELDATQVSSVRCDFRLTCWIRRDVHDNNVFTFALQKVGSDLRPWSSVQCNPMTDCESG